MPPAPCLSPLTPGRLQEGRRMSEKSPPSLLALSKSPLGFQMTPTSTVKMG